MSAQLALDLVKQENTAVVAQVLSTRRGRAKGISVKLLAQLTGVHERGVRTAVSELREQGLAVCSHPSAGYWIADSAEELDDCCKFLRSRALHSLLLEARLRKVALPDLLDQLRLPT